MGGACSSASKIEQSKIESSGKKMAIVKKSDQQLPAAENSDVEQKEGKSPENDEQSEEGEGEEPLTNYANGKQGGPMCKESQRRIVTSNRDRLPTRGPHSVTQLSTEQLIPEDDVQVAIAPLRAACVARRTGFGGCCY